MDCSGKSSGIFEKLPHAEGEYWWDMMIRVGIAVLIGMEAVSAVVLFGQR